MHLDRVNTLLAPCERGDDHTHGGVGIIKGQPDRSCKVIPRACRHDAEANIRAAHERGPESNGAVAPDDHESVKGVDDGFGTPLRREGIGGRKVDHRHTRGAEQSADVVADIP